MNHEVDKAQRIPGILLSHCCSISLSLAAPNPCAANEGRGPCSHLCLINHNRSAACACPHLMKLSSDKKTCYGKFPKVPSQIGMDFFFQIPQHSYFTQSEEILNAFKDSAISGESDNPSKCGIFAVCCCIHFFCYILFDELRTFISAKQMREYKFTAQEVMT